MYKESAAPRLQARLTFGSSSLAPPPELPRLAQTGPAPSLPAPQVRFIIFELFICAKKKPAAKKQITLIHKYGQSSAYPNQYNHYPICSITRASKAQLGPRSATVNLAHNTLSSELDASAYVALPTLLLLEHQYVPLEFEFLHYIGIHPHLSTILLACYVLGLTSLFTTAKFYI
ncbi:hypothetical protein PGT21_009110 [Puccinia graminis f. sp. tritici]|uniref:Uncharacterized protein n=1 Tax=Puccinia graminis f. sp. tritici TaxID=56615 RepID=A0A5B0NF70_PUCGR|nr:hypothetical protein PGT21_009110 [Puccinia graminis f. sp. tritici]